MTSNPALQLRQLLLDYRPQSLLFMNGTMTPGSGADDSDGANRIVESHRETHRAMGAEIEETIEKYCAPVSIHCAHFQLEIPATLDERFDICVVHNVLEHLDKQQGMQLLARLRNVLSQRIWVSVSSTADWQFNDFIGLGFTALIQTPANPDYGDTPPTMQCYGYDLAQYNRVRRWNNPRFWANPENWNKFRW